MSFSNYLENKALDFLFGGSAFTPAGTVYASLHDSAPGETGASEMTGGSYARQALVAASAFTAASAGAISNNNDIDFAGMPAGTVVGAGVWDASSSGNFLGGGTITSGLKVVNADDTFRISAGDLDISLD